MKLFLAICLLLGLNHSYSQTKEFTFYDNVSNIEEPLSLNIYTKGELLNIQSDTKGKITLQEKMIAKADSIFVNYSFYRLPLKKEDFSKENIQLKPEISLESVVVKEKKPGKVISKSNRLFNSTLTKNLNNKKLIGLRYKFKSRSYHHNISSANKRFKVLLLGFNKEPQKDGLTNGNFNRAYNLLGDSSITVSIPQDVPKWVEVYVGSEINYNEYKYIAFGLVSIDPSIIIEGSKQKKFPKFEEVKVSMGATFNGITGNYVSLPNYYKGYGGKLYSIQLILK